jgi:hypothetical protein
VSLLADRNSIYHQKWLLAVTVCASPNNWKRSYSTNSGLLCWAPCSFVRRRTHRLSVTGRAMVTTYETTWCHNAEDHSQRLHRLENLQFDIGTAASFPLWGDMVFKYAQGRPGLQGPTLYNCTRPGPRTVWPERGVYLPICLPDRSPIFSKSAPTIVLLIRICLNI